MNFKNSKLVEVVWRDAFTVDGWHTFQEVVEKSKSGDKARTVGWLIHEDEIRIVLASGIGLDLETEVGSAWVIPKEMIVESRIIEEERSGS